MLLGNGSASVTSVVIVDSNSGGRWEIGGLGSGSGSQYMESDVRMEPVLGI